MLRIPEPLLACALLANAPSKPDNSENASPSPAGELNEPSAQPPTVDDICRALEQSAAESGLPVEFFARVIRQESRFDAQTVSQEGAEGIAQFKPPARSRRPVRSETCRISNSVLLSSNFGRRAK